jgi:hypothetical protein
MHLLVVAAFWNWIPFETLVIPAKAGIHFASHRKYADDGLDSRLRGNDCPRQSAFRANDTTSTFFERCKTAEIAPILWAIFAAPNIALQPANNSEQPQPT